MMPEEGTSYQATYVPLAPSPKHEAASPSTRIHAILPDPEKIRAIQALRGTDKVSAGVVNDAEVDAVSRVVLHVLGRDGGAPWTVVDPHTGEERAARAGDVAVLVRRVARGDAVHDALQGAGVPSVVFGGKRF
jgi:ATP-dependent exoDNAse (exonuclease V) beta subunit